MRHYQTVAMCLQGTMRHLLPLSDAQASRVAALGEALLLAGDIHLTKIARLLPQPTQQDSRVRWIKRLLQAPFMRQEQVYAPFLTHFLQGVHDPIWHLVMDRTNLWDSTLDLATISFNYRKRAIPLAWCLVPFGGAPLKTYVELLGQVVPLIPTHVSVLFHADSEFGGAVMIRALRELGWDFILAQSSTTHFYATPHADGHPLASLKVPHTGIVTHANIDLFAEERIAHLNLVAFYAPHFARGQHKRDITYLVTSLPLSPSLRRLGRRRWGTEPFYRDYKSSGWHVTDSHLQDRASQHGLLVMLALLYLWATAYGRWLCKTCRRREVDAKAYRQRHLSLFRLGWDWLVHCLRCADPIPPLTTLYS